MVIVKALLFLTFLFLAVYGYLKLIPILVKDGKTAFSWLTDKYIAHLEKRHREQPKTSGGDYFDDDDTEQIELDEQMYQEIVDEYNPHEYDNYED